MDFQKLKITKKCCFFSKILIEKTIFLVTSGLALKRHSKTSYGEKNITKKIKNQIFVKQIATTLQVLRKTT